MEHTSRPDDRRAAELIPLWLVVGFGTAMAPLVVGSPVLGKGGAALAALHVVVLSAAIFALRRRGSTMAAIGDWLPFVALPLFYAEIPTGIAMLGTSYHDLLIQSWDQTAFGAQPARNWAPHMAWVPLSELLHAAYLSYYAIVFVPPVAAALMGKRAAFVRSSIAVTLAYAVCFAVFVVFPVQGPRYEWGALATVPSGPIRHLVLRILAAGSSRGAAFPSSHVALSMAQSVAAFRWDRALGACLTTLSVLLACGAVYGGFHYATDAIVGGVVGTCCGAVALRLLR